MKTSRETGRKEREKDRKQKDKEFFLRFADGHNNKSRMNVRICTKKKYAHIGKTVGSDIAMI